MNVDSAGQPRTNWAGNITYGAADFYRPATISQLQAVVARAAQIRVLATGHSFNDMADSPGAPVSLALRALPAAGRAAPPGMREWLLAALHSPLSRFLTNPIVATVLFVAGFYGLYFGGIFDSAVGSHAGHLAMNLHFLLSGYLFYWVVIGVDPTPRPIPPLAKVAVIFASLPLHAFFGVLLMGTKEVMGADYYRSLGLSWHTDLLGDQRLGGGIAWAAGELPLVIVMLALLVQWARSDDRIARRLDRAADLDDDAELVAYNAMLAEMSRRDPPERSPQPAD